MSVRTIGMAAVAIVTLATLGCLRDVGSMVELQLALHQEYPGAQIQVGFLNGPQHLNVRFDSTAFHELPDAPLRAKGREISQFVLKHYGDATALDSVTIEFVRQHTQSLLSSSWEFTVQGYAASELRTASP